MRLLPKIPSSKDTFQSRWLEPRIDRAWRVTQHGPFSSRKIPAAEATTRWDTGKQFSMWKAKEEQVLLIGELIQECHLLFFLRSNQGGKRKFTVFHLPPQHCWRQRKPYRQWREHLPVAVLNHLSIEGGKSWTWLYIRTFITLLVDIRQREVKPKVDRYNVSSSIPGSVTLSTSYGVENVI